MANQIQLFMIEEDEIAFLRLLERFTLEVYPRRVPQDWKAFRARLEFKDRFPEEDVYLAATELGPVMVDKVKRGPDKGFWRVDEVRSPVIFWERCRMNEDGELLSGQLWGELDITPQTGRRDSAPDRFRTMFKEIEESLRKTYRRAEPKPFLVGPHCARRKKETGLVLRNNEHRGGTIEVWK